MSELEGHLVYECVLRLGTSSCGNATTVVARNRYTKELVSIKLIKRGWDKAASKHLLKTSFTHMELSICLHPHIVEFREAFILPNHLAIVLEYVEGETLELFLERIGGRMIENMARFIFQQLVIAVDFCHRKGKILRDLKPSTILLHISEGTLPLLKLCDFASSLDIGKGGYVSSEEEDQMGSALYVAPEVIMPPEDETVQIDSRAADLYTCGIILYICIYGSHPFLPLESESTSESESVVEMFQRALECKAEFPATLPPLKNQKAQPSNASTVTPACIAILRGLLNPDPAHRLTTNKLMASPWFKDSLPPGAADMNTMLLEDPNAPILGPNQVATFQSLVKKAAVDNGSCDAEPLSSISPSPEPQSSEGPSIHRALAPLVLHQPTPADSSSSKGSQPLSGDTSPAAFLGRSGPSRLGQRLQMFDRQGSLLPLESMSGLSDALMRIPTGILLNAAVEDLRSESPRMMDLKQFPSLVAPRSPSSLDKALLTSPNFLKEMYEFGPAAALRQAKESLGGVVPGSSLVTRISSINITDLQAIISAIEDAGGGWTTSGPSEAYTSGGSPPKAKGKRRARDRSRFGNESDVHTAPRNFLASVEVLPEDVAAATDAVMAALNEVGGLGSAPSLQFPWIEGPETLPLASVSAMDVAFDWNLVQREMSGAQPAAGGLMESPWAKLCQSAASHQQLKRLKK